MNISRRLQSIGIVKKIDKWMLYAPSGALRRLKSIGEKKEVKFFSQRIRTCVSQITVEKLNVDVLDTADYRVLDNWRSTHICTITQKTDPNLSGYSETQRLRGC